MLLRCPSTLTLPTAAHLQPPLQCVDPLCAVCGPPAKCLHCQATAYDDYTEYPVYRDSAGRCKLVRAGPAAGAVPACTAAAACQHQLCARRCAALPRGHARHAPSQVQRAGCEAWAQPQGRQASSTARSAALPMSVQCRAQSMDGTNCAACDRGGRCSFCLSGYFLKDGSCRPCSDRLCEWAVLQACQRPRRMHHEWQQLGTGPPSCWPEEYRLAERTAHDLPALPPRQPASGSAPSLPALHATTHPPAHRAHVHVAQATRAQATSARGARRGHGPAT